MLFSRFAPKPRRLLKICLGIRSIKVTWARADGGSTTWRLRRGNRSVHPTNNLVFHGLSLSRVSFSPFGDQAGVRYVDYLSRNGVHSPVYLDANLGKKNPRQQ